MVSKVKGVSNYLFCQIPPSSKAIKPFLRLDAKLKHPYFLMAVIWFKAHPVIIKEEREKY
jgi:hypothetical protein